MAEPETQYERARRWLRPFLLGAAALVGLLTIGHGVAAATGDGSWLAVARGAVAVAFFVVGWRTAPRNGPGIATADLAPALICAVLGLTSVMLG